MRRVLDAAHLEEHRHRRGSAHRGPLCTIKKFQKRAEIKSARCLRRRPPGPPGETATAYGPASWRRRARHSPRRRMCLQRLRIEIMFGRGGERSASPPDTADAHTPPSSRSHPPQPAPPERTMGAAVKRRRSDRTREGMRTSSAVSKAAAEARRCVVEQGREGKVDCGHAERLSPRTRADRCPQRCELGRGSNAARPPIVRCLKTPPARCGRGRCKAAV